MSTFSVVVEVEVEAANPIDAAKNARALLADADLERAYDVFPMEGAAHELPGAPVEPVGWVRVTLWGDSSKVTEGSV